LTERFESGELLSSIGLGVAESTFGVSRQVTRTRSILIVKIAGEIPTHLIPLIRDSTSCGRSDDVEAFLVDLLKEERSIHGGSVEDVVERVRTFGNTVRGRVTEPIEIVVVTVVDHGTSFDRSSVVSESRSTADGLSETESEETDECHRETDDAEETNLFSESVLSIFRSIA